MGKPTSSDPQYWAAAMQRQVANEFLCRHVQYVATRSTFYRRRFAEVGFDATAFRDVTDLARVPPTSKADLEDGRGEFLCVDEDEVVDLCLTSGTTGKPVALLQARADLERLAENERRALTIAGLTRRDRVLVAASIDRCFMAGLAYFLGLTRIGALAMRAGSNHPAALAQMIREQRPTALLGVPSTLLAAADALRADGVEPREAGVSRIVGIGEPLRRPDLSATALAERLAAAYGARLHATYASTEMATAFAECEAGSGGHVPPDLIVVEILDDDGNPVEPGTPGEVVATPLQVSGMPLVRIRTGDIACLFTGPCACGRTTPRLGPVLGRKHQMLKVRGTTVYPPAISDVVQAIDSIANHYVEVWGQFELSERLRVVVGIKPGVTLEPGWVADRLAARLRVRPEVQVTSERAVAEKITVEGKRKAALFFDYRSEKEHVA